MPDTNAKWRGEWLVFAGIVVAVLVARAQSFGDPVLGFDEQYYLLVADRWLHGALPYVDIWDRKPLGLFMLYAGAIVPGRIGWGDPFLNYKLLAALFVAATAFVIYRGGRRDAGPFGAGVAALLYVFWLNFMEGEGGQSPVFYNLPVLVAGLLVRRAIGRRGPLFGCGLAAMLLVGLAIQIKYTVVFEGVFFGLALIWAGHRAWGRSRRLGMAALVWSLAALAPTLLGFAVYWAMGEARAFVFANFLSIFGRLSDPLWDRLAGLATIIAILAPLAIVAVLAGRQRAGLAFEQAWAAVAAVGILAVGAFLSPHYGLPLLAPLCLCAAPWFASARRGRQGAAVLLGLSLVGGTLALHQIILGKGGARKAREVAAAARPAHGGCIWVWDGYPALYLLANACVPTKWAFPGHLNTQDEASVGAIGVDPASEVRRILASRPEAIVDDFPAYKFGNAKTRQLVQAELARSYRLAARVETGRGRFRLVYRLK